MPKGDELNALLKLFLTNNNQAGSVAERVLAKVASKLADEVSRYTKKDDTPEFVSRRGILVGPRPGTPVTVDDIESVLNPSLGDFMNRQLKEAQVSDQGNLTPGWEYHVDTGWSPTLADLMQSIDPDWSPRSASQKSPVDNETEISLMEIASEMVDEALRAATIHAPLNSPHEASSVIREEFEELWEHVKADTGTSRDARKEAIQLGAMAMRYILNLIDFPNTPAR